MLYLVAGLLLVAAPQLSLQQIGEAPLVETSLGKISGSILKSQANHDIYAYRGIPYAEAPLGELRFKKPVPVKAWDRTFEAKQDSLVCPQSSGLPLAAMSEDCLTLNVFTRNMTAHQPVLVYIHGGANVLGSGHSEYEAGPQYLLDHDVVLVAFNYRLGALGFLSTDSTESHGNFGYFDQVLALQWVQEHIHHFGGDNSSVTIFGLSAGSMAVSLHMASEMSAGLFHRAIAMSGAATNHFAIDNLHWTRKLAREIKCPMYNAQDVLDCLRSKSWQEIIEVCSRWEPYGFTNMKWNYEVDGEFLKKHPNELFLKGEFSQVPLMAGITRNELDFSLYHQENNTGLLNDIGVNFDLYAPEMFMFNGNDNLQKGQQIQKFYYSNETSITKANLENLGEAFSDAIIGHGVHSLVNLARRRLDVYYYRMDYVGEHSLYTNYENKPRGVGHADDIHYIMPGSWYGAQMANDDPDMVMVKRLTTLWVSFARDGQPSFEEGIQVEWLPSNQTYVRTLYNDKTPMLADPPYQDRYQLWDGLFPYTLSSGSIAQFSLIITGSLSSALLWLNIV